MGDVVTITCHKCGNEQPFRGKGNRAKCTSCKRFFYIKEVSASVSVGEGDAPPPPTDDSDKDVDPSSLESIAAQYDKGYVIPFLKKDKTDKKGKKDSGTDDLFGAAVDVQKGIEDGKIDKKDWEEIVNALSDEEWGEIYNMINESLNKLANTDAFTMSEKRAKIIGKLTKKTLITLMPKIKVWHILVALLAFHYGVAGITLVFEYFDKKKKEEKAEKEAEKHAIAHINSGKKSEDKKGRGSKGKG